MGKLLYLKEYLAKKMFWLPWWRNYKVSINQSTPSFPNLYEIEKIFMYRHSKKSFVTIHEKSKKLIITITYMAGFLSIDSTVHWLRF